MAQHSAHDRWAFMPLFFSSIREMAVWPTRHPARAGALAGWFQQACSILVSLLLIPVVTLFLSPDKSGIWFSFQGLVTMIGLLDLGFGFAISRQVAFTSGAANNIKARNDFIHVEHGWKGVRQLFYLTRSLYRWLAAAGACLGIVAYEIFSRVGQLIPSDMLDARWCWYAMVIASCLLILAAGYGAFVNGLGAVYQTRFLAGLYQIVAGIGAAFAVWQGWGLPAMGASYAIGALLYLVAVKAVLKVTAKPMQAANFVPPKPGSLKALARFALPVGGVNVFGSLVYTIQTPLLGMLLGPEKVAPFYLAQKMAMAFNMAAMQTVLPKLPFFTQRIGAQDYEAAKTLMTSTIRHGTLLVIVASLGFFLLSPWAAEALLKNTAFIDTTTRALIAVDLALLGCTVIWGHFVLASGRNPFVISTILTGITTIALTILLVPLLKVAALPLATMLAGLMFNMRRNLSEGIRTLRTLS